MSEGEFMVRYTNKDIMEKLESLDNTTQQILSHAQLTNGRVNLLEKKSIGMWVSNNPMKFTLFVLTFTAIVISDIRQPLLQLVGNFLGFA